MEGPREGVPVGEVEAGAEFKYVRREGGRAEETTRRREGVKKAGRAVYLVILSGRDYSRKVS
jgi:hypothetical protein